MPNRIYDISSKGKNVSEMVYTILHKNIVNLNLEPGTQMSEKDISEKMNVSRTPVREAFIRLSNEALVTIRPQKGTFVSKIDLDRVEEERFLREAIELQVLDAFFELHSEQAVERLLRSIEKQKKALEDEDLEKFIDYDDQFHSIFFSEAKKRMCYSVLQSSSSHYKRIRYLSIMIADITKLNVDNHIDLVECVKKNNLEDAKDMLKQHLRKLLVEEDEIIEKYSQYFELSGKPTSEVDIMNDFSEIFKNHN